MKKIEFTPELREMWFEQGYLHLKNVLDESEVRNIRDAAQNMIKKKAVQSSRSSNNYLGNHGSESYNILQAIEYSDALDYLVDHNKIFDLIVKIMGPYLQVSGIDLFVRKPITTLSDLNRFHTDGGPSLQKILPHRDNFPLLIKVQYFATDLLEEDTGSIMVVPGSHLKRVKYYDKNCFIHECNTYVEKGSTPPTAKQIKLKAGDVFIHPWTLWHAVAPNKSNNTRISVSVRYSQIWCRPYYNFISQEVLSRLTPRQRRLFGDLGDGSTPSSYYTPPQQEEIIRQTRF